MKAAGLVIVASFLSCSVAARDLTIGDQQQQAVSIICEKAARSPASTIDEVASIAQFCVNWRELVARNNAAPPQSAPAPETPEK